jgi:glycogen synthase
MSTRDLTVSVVINTYNRAASLDATLRSLRRLNYPRFEVIVVNGPSTDNTMEVLRAHAASIRVGTCSDRNLSISRNAGIEMARGDLVAFLDDDAVPDENWLNDAVDAFDSEEVGGVGGFVYDHTGYNLQYRYSVSNRLGTARWDVAEPKTEFCYPGCLEFPYLQGTNAIFRRSALLEIGGFDEEFNYYLDETDVCLRLVDAGYLLKQLSNAFVYHRFLPSHIRSENRVVTSWHPIIKNKVYFSLANAPSEIPARDLLKDWDHFCAEAEAGLKFHLGRGAATQQNLDEFYTDVNSALREGMRAGHTSPRRFLHAERSRELRGSVKTDVLDEGPSGQGQFKLYPTVMPQSKKLTICLLSQEYPPAIVGGIGRLTYELACGLAERGHDVHVLTKSLSGHNTVDFEEDVWVHRLVEDREEPPAPQGVNFPEPLWRRSARLLREIRRINETHPVDIVEGPIWDAEGLATVLDGSFVSVTSLETPLKMALETNPGWVDGSAAQRQVYDAIIAGEKAAIERATAIRAISGAIVETMRSLYDIEFAPDRLSITPIGMHDRSAGKSFKTQSRFIDVLFAGRFEDRKGIDVLLQVIPSLCQEFKRARFILVGEDRPRADGSTLSSRFCARHARAPFRDRVIFPGKVSDSEIERYLAQCEIFVGPSRYESFGLVFVEAMMFGKSVVGCRVGGMKEVIAEGVTGLLAEPGDPESLRAALASLLADPAKRETFGKAGRARFLEHYTREKLADRTLAFYSKVLANQSSDQLSDQISDQAETQMVTTQAG